MTTKAFSIVYNDFCLQYYFMDLTSGLLVILDVAKVVKVVFNCYFLIF